MTAANQLNAGSRLPASALRSIAPLAAYKGALESVTSSSTLQNDDALFLTLLANATYDLDMFVAYNGGTQGSSDLKGAFAIPSGATLVYGFNSNGLTSTPHVGFYGSGTGAFTAGTGATTATNWTLRLSGTIVTSAAGVLQFQWAQATSSATATSVLPGSKLTAVQIA